MVNWEWRTGNGELGTEIGGRRSEVGAGPCACPIHGSDVGEHRAEGKKVRRLEG